MARGITYNLAVDNVADLIENLLSHDGYVGIIGCEFSSLTFDLIAAVGE